MHVSDDDVDRRYLEDWIETQNWFFLLRCPYFPMGLAFASWIVWDSVIMGAASFIAPMILEYFAWRWRKRVPHILPMCARPVHYSRHLTFYVGAIYAVYLAPLILIQYAPGFDNPLLVQSMAACHLAIMSAGPPARLLHALPPIGIALGGFLYPVWSSPDPVDGLEIMLISGLATAIVCLAYVQIKSGMKRFRAELEREALWREHAGLVSDLRRTRAIADAQRESVREASQERSAFLAMMSHEIRTPMNAIMGFADFLASRQRNEQAREYGNYILVAARSLFAVLNDVLYFSRMEAGKVSIILDKVDIATLVGTPAFWRMHVVDKEIVFNVEHEDLDEIQVLADSARVQQLVSNLVSNTVKFTPSGGHVSLRVISRGVSNKRMRLRFEVRGSGDGIDDEIARDLLQSLNRNDEDIARDFGSASSGLAISARLVDLMGGSIGAIADPGSSAMFWFEIIFPLYESEAVVRSFAHNTASRLA